MYNTSFAELQTQIATARKQALSMQRHSMERTDTVVCRSGKVVNLIDYVHAKRMGHDSVQRISPEVKARIETIFAKYPIQLEYLGMYFATIPFTCQEIADIKGVDKTTVSRTVSRAKKRLQKYLTPEEYDSIRWALGDYKRIEPTPREPKVNYVNTRNSILDNITFPIKI